MKLTLRGDSGFCRWRLMRWCDSRGVGYVLGLARNPALERAARDATDQAAQRFERTGVPQRLFDAFAYATKSWDRPRRVIVKAEHNAQGANPRFIVSNEPGDRQRLCDEVYCHRGKMGNRIKELQLDLFAHRTSCHRFLANPFRLLLSSAPYVLSQVLRRTTLHGTELAEAQVGTIRPQLLKVAAQVVVIVRRVVFQLASSYPCQSIFRHVHQQLTAPPPPVLGAP